MSAKIIENIEWYSDKNALQRGEPGVYHSFLASLATALNHFNGDIDPAWLMGSSAFAFRIIINETNCPSAMSIFDWSFLPEAVKQMGLRCNYISRLWHEGDKEEERKQEAHQAIIEAIDRGVPAVVWDINDVEWGLIIGYDTDKNRYETLSYRGKQSNLPFEKLGKNGIDILSVAIPGEANNRSREDIILNSLRAAVAHAEQKEWMDRPKYQDGLPAFDLWSLIFERWAMLEEAGKSSNIGVDIMHFSEYYAGHHFSARCYARDYLKSIANDNETIHKASQSYEKVASRLKPIWDRFLNKKKPDVETLRSFSQNIKDAKLSEVEGIGHLKDYIQSCE
jgi:hypothetical protein